MVRIIFGVHQNKKPARYAGLELCYVPEKSAVVTDRFDWAGFQGFLALLLFLVILGLFVNKGKTLVFIGLKIVGRRGAAHITINTIRVYVVLSVYATFNLVIYICHLPISFRGGFPPPIFT